MRSRARNVTRPAAWRINSSWMRVRKMSLLMGKRVSVVGYFGF
jgi:hypothetical protein